MPDSTLQSLARYRGFLVDVDGTLMHGAVAVPEAGAAIAHLRETGRRVVLTTNNSFFSGHELAAHLRALGVFVDSGEILSTVDATVALLARSDPGAPVLVVGSPALKAALSDGGFDVLHGARGARYVVTGGDRTFDYQKLTEAVRAILAGAKFVATNRDGYMIEPDGVHPGGGAIAGAIVGAIGRDPDVVVGKPSTGLFEEALRRIGLPEKDCVVVGDSLATDVTTARQCGLASLLVLTGVTDRGLLDGAPLQPDFVLTSIAELQGL